MFYAFEIRNDMTHSVHVFNRLNTQFLKKNGPISLHWCSVGAFKGASNEENDNQTNMNSSS